MANDFNSDFERREDDFYQHLFKRKLDAEEIKEIELKADARRKKAYKNYEEACKIKGKFTVRTCPKLQECTTKNKQTYIPLLSEKANLTTVAPTTKPNTPATTTKKSIFSIIKGGKREFIERTLAMEFLSQQLEDEETSSDDDDNDDSDGFFKRFLKKNPNAELIEETKERRDKAFKKYEEYCEKRLFRIGSKRNCPALDKKLC